jgi:hypothetical protein
LLERRRVRRGRRMSEFLRLIWDICCLRRGPQDLPYAPLLLGVLCVVSVVLDAIFSRDAMTVLVGVGMLLAYLGALHTLLRVRGLANRFVQCATALVACALLFELIQTPLQLMLGGGKSLQPSPFNGLVVMAILGVLVWKVVVDARIFRDSLNVPFAVGLGISLGWLIFIIYVTHLLMPSGPAA